MEKEIGASPVDEKGPGEDEAARRKSTASRVIRDARLATDKEHNMTLWQGIKLYPKAVGWSVLISTCIAMEGYDVCLLSNFYGFPQFNRYVFLSKRALGSRG